MEVREEVEEEVMEEGGEDIHGEEEGRSDGEGVNGVVIGIGNLFFLLCYVMCAHFRDQ